MQTLYLVRIGEIALKKGNRDFFEKSLRRNIEKALKGHLARVEIRPGRFFVHVKDASDEAEMALIEGRLSQIFGIVSFSRALALSREDFPSGTLKITSAVELGPIHKAAAQLLTASLSMLGAQNSEREIRFAVSARRSNKGQGLTSKEYEIELAGPILEKWPHLKVDLTSPELVLYLEMREKAYLYTEKKPGLGGMPVSSAGTGIALLSGGIDSPVAMYMMAKRGLAQSAAYFHAPPYTSERVLDKVLRLGQALAPYVTPFLLYVVPFTKIQVTIKKDAPEGSTTLLSRYAMVKISTLISEKLGALALTSGESLAQVASQTLKGMYFTGAAAGHLPMFRPLIGFDKEEIIQISKSRGFFDISTEPFDDCCALFAPEKPTTNPNFEILLSQWEALELDGEIKKAAESATVYKITTTGADIIEREI